MPGKYQVVLTANGHKYTQPLTVTMDPRVKTSTAELQQQFDLSQQVYRDLLTLQPINEQVEKLRAQIKAQRAKSLSDADTAKLDAFTQKLDAFAGAEGRRRRGTQQAPTLSSVRGSLFEIFSVLQDADVAPTPQAAKAVPVLSQSTQTLVKQWEELQKTELPQLKQQLGILAFPQVTTPRNSWEGMNQDEQ